MSGNPPNPSVLTLLPDATQADTVRTWCGNAVVAENVGYARTARVVSVVHSKSQNGKNHENIMLEVQVEDKTSWILTDRNGGAGGDSSPSLFPSPAASRADLAASLSSTDAFDRIVVPEFGKLPALKLYIDDDPVVACTLELHPDAFFSLAELAGLLPIVNAMARKYNPVSKQCYWYARAVYESIKKKCPESGEVKGKAYKLRGTHFKLPVPCRVSTSELETIEAQWSARTLEISKVETISQVNPSILDWTLILINRSDRCKQILVQQKTVLGCQKERRNNQRRMRRRLGGTKRRLGGTKSGR